jgi:tetratricopeptide (TPR) repeat protein
MRRHTTFDRQAKRQAVKTALRILTLTTIALAASLMMVAQTPAVNALLARARTQEQAGHIDLAAQTWQQVLLVDANDREALAGLARSAKLAGNESAAKGYLDRLRHIDPHSNEIAKIEATPSSKAQTAQLQKAAQLAQTGHPEEALRVYRSVWGNRPPDGDWALAYYDTEAGVEAERSDAESHLRELARKYPADTRYSITLGRILTYTPRTRPEGIQLLERFAQDSAAQKALTQAHQWDAQSAAAAQAHPSQGQPADTGIARGAAESAAFAALAADHVDEAQERFLALQTEQPDNPRVLAGLGFLRMKQSNFTAAIDLLDQAEKNGLHRRDVDDALKTSRFWATVQHGTDALNANRLDEAEGAYKSALLLRPGSIDALNGLSGTYMKAGRPADAIPVYRQILKLEPRSADAWRGLFNAQVQAGQVADALDTSRRLPLATKAELQRNPEFLRQLAAAYTSNGQADQAKATLDQALALPLPDNGRKLKTEDRLQYAALLSDAKCYAQAAGLYRDLINDDPESLPAWQGLISVQHQAGHDAEALATIQRMSPGDYDAALDDSGFLSMMAAIYVQQNRFELAQQLLQRAAASLTAKGQTVPVPMQLQIASIAMQQNHPDQAYAIFRAVLSEHTERVDAWKGLISALHQTHRDREALAQLRQIPIDVRRQLDRDADYQQVVAGVYTATGNPAAALQLIAQIQAHYRALHGVAPAEIDIQDAWLLYNTHDDQDLYRALMALGGRDDLSDDQRRVVQTIWATWSVRRAGEAVDAGNAKRSIEILRAAYQAFPDNPDVSKALAGGYLKAGDAKRAEAIYLALHLANPSAADYQSMVGAALAAPDLHQAELWLRDALDKFSSDPQVLAMAARFEQARGDHARAAGYWKASLAAMPPSDPTNRLAHVLDRADAKPVRQGADLSSLLDPNNEAARSARPPLPSYGNTYAASQSHNPAPPASSLYGPDPYLLGTAPVRIDGSSAAESPSPIASLNPTSEANDAFAPPEIFSDTRHDTGDVAAAPNPAIHYPGGERSPASNTAGITLDPKPSQAASNVRYAQPGADPQPQELFTRQAAAVEPEQVQAPVLDLQPQSQSLPPLRGPWTAQPVVHETDPRSETENQLAVIDAGYSPWRGGTGYISHRTGTPGFDQLEILEAPFEGSTTIGGSTRLTAIVLPSLLDSGVADGSSTDQLGTLAAGAKPAQQNSAGVGGEVQLTTSNLGLSAGTTPRGFLVPNITGRISIHPASGPLKLDFVREGIKDSQLSYAGLRDPGSISSTYAGNIWGGVVSNAGNLQYSRGDDTSGYYAGFGGQYITGLNVLTNNRVDGVAGAYWKVMKVPDSYDVTVGANFFAMHYAHNLRFFTYGQGGYFSPSVYFLANIPFTVNGQYGSNLHYTIAGALGLQAFQEDSSLYYPTHVYTATATTTAPTSALGHNGFDTPSLRPVLPITPVIPVPFNNPSYPAQSVVGGNYDLHAEVSDHLVDRWYIGGFLNLNNTRDYANQTVGFFIRYMQRSQDLNEGEPTGLFPIQGLRPLLVP